MRQPDCGAHPGAVRAGVGAAARLPLHPGTGGTRPAHAVAGAASGAPYAYRAAGLALESGGDFADGVIAAEVPAGGTRICVVHQQAIKLLKAQKRKVVRCWRDSAYLQTRQSQQLIGYCHRMAHCSA